MTKYIPSKVCPHRYCKYIHKTLGWSSLAVGAVSPVLWLQILAAVSVACSVYFWHLRRKRNLPKPQLPIERPNQYLIVRRWWARLALGLDLGAVSFLLFGVVLQVQQHAAGEDPIRSASSGALVAATVVASVILLSYTGLLVFCHWMASRPGKPKRVRVPRGVSFQGAA